MNKREIIRKCYFSCSDILTIINRKGHSVKNFDTDLLQLKNKYESLFDILEDMYEKTTICVKCGDENEECMADIDHGHDSESVTHG